MCLSANRYPPRRDGRYLDLCGSGRNFLVAAMPSDRKIASTTSCATRKGGSDCVGASGFEHRQLLEGLNDGDDDVEIQRDDRADDVDPAPSAGEVVDVEAEDRDSQDHEGENADHVRRQQMCGVKKEVRSRWSVRWWQETARSRFRASGRRSMPNSTTIPARIAARLMATWNTVNIEVDIPRIMTCILSGCE